MGKKKKTQVFVLKPWCWYCEREFEDEKGKLDRPADEPGADPRSAAAAPEVEALQVSALSAKAEHGRRSHGPLAASAQDGTGTPHKHATGTRWVRDRDLRNGRSAHERAGRVEGEEGAGGWCCCAGGCCTVQASAVSVQRDPGGGPNGGFGAAQGAHDGAEKRCHPARLCAGHAAADAASAPGRHAPTHTPSGDAAIPRWCAPAPAPWTAAALPTTVPLELPSPSPRYGSAGTTAASIRSSNVYRSSGDSGTAHARRSGRHAAAKRCLLARQQRDARREARPAAEVQVHFSGSRGARAEAESSGGFLVDLDLRSHTCMVSYPRQQTFGVGGSHSQTVRRTDLHVWISSSVYFASDGQ